MSTYQTTIGLEVHAELSTNSKMFCGCKNHPHGSEPNEHTCPVCLAHPGTLPVPNKEAVSSVLLFGSAVSATPAVYSEFDRKNYFYPDIPKAYQISQYQFPFLTGGSVNGVKLTRVHLEEDTARSSHEISEGSLVDFNRAGVPLMELVTEPVITSAAMAGDFARELQLLLQTIGISKANMERGEMRIEANISISKTSELGTKVEVKNINSFKAVESAIAYEVKRQQEVLESGSSVIQETRGWDENKNKTFSQRAKETAKDYRYFPDPDIPKLDLSLVSDMAQEVIAKKLPMLPSEKRSIYNKSGIAKDLIEVIISDKESDFYFSELCQQTNNPELHRLASNYLTGDLVSLRGDGLVLSEVPVDLFIEMLTMLHSGEIGSRAAKDMLPKLAKLNTSVREYVEKNGLLQLSGGDALLPVVTEIINNNENQVKEFRAGKETVLKFLVGQGMKMTKGAANPQELEDLLKKQILP